MKNLDGESLPIIIRFANEPQEKFHFENDSITCEDLQIRGVTITRAGKKISSLTKHTNVKHETTDDS